jgi:hypothetical protein
MSPVIRPPTGAKSGSLKKGFIKKALLNAKGIDEDLNQLERDIRMLKIEYEQFFGGGKKRPPDDIEWRIEQVMKRYSDRGAEMNYAQRFRYGNLSQTYSKYKEIFHKRARKREEGTVERHYGAAARAIEAERVRLRPPQQPPPPPELSPVAIRCNDPAQEPKKVEQIYNAFRQALEQSGQSVDQLSPKAFEQFLQRKVEQLRRQKGGQDVEVVVSLEGGKASLKARVKT